MPSDEVKSLLRVDPNSPVAAQAFKNLHASPERISQKSQAFNDLHQQGAAKAKDGEALKAATDFEALLLHEMFKSMWATVPRDTLLGGQKEEELYRDMLNQGLAQEIAEGQSIGVRDVILRDIKKLEERGESPGPPLKR